MFNSRKKIQILQEELYITRLENASLRARLAKALAKEEAKPKKAVAKKTTTKKVAK
jgi:regulator of replication initiation timing